MFDSLNIVHDTNVASTVGGHSNYCGSNSSLAQERRTTILQNFLENRSSIMFSAIR